MEPAPLLTSQNCLEGRVDVRSVQRRGLDERQFIFRYRKQLSHPKQDKAPDHQTYRKIF